MILKIINNFQECSIEIFILRFALIIEKKIICHIFPIIFNIFLSQKARNVKQISFQKT